MTSLVLIILSNVSQPFPGVTLVENGQSAMTIVNLCAPGVAVRATKYDERRGTPQAWAQRVGAQVAINADFFDFPGWSLVVGRARGAGEDWPSDKQFLESRLYWYFGLFTAGLQADANVPPAGAPWMTEIVGGHNPLMRDGHSLGPTFDGDGVLQSGHRRTAVGLSADKRTLYFMASNKLLDGNGMVAELIALQQEAGAPPIDVATNMDGGGSSQLYVQGRGQVITSGREVNNHLGVFASGSGFAPNCNNLPPRGTLDAATCEGISGWSQDPTTPDAPVDVQLDFGDGHVTTVKADQRREDLCSNLMSCNHGFTARVPKALLDGQAHLVTARGVDLENGSAWKLEQGEKTFSCRVDPPAGGLRHVINPESFAAWRFSFFDDVQSVTDAQLAARDVLADFPAKPELIRAEGRPEVWLVDGEERRHVRVEVVGPWRLDLASVRVVASTELARLREGAPLGMPWLVKGSGPAVYVVDVPASAPLVLTSLGVPARSSSAGSASSDSGGVVGGCSTGGAGGGAGGVVLLLALWCRRRR
ncbi:MAG: phosphodiester glycosidase family protein [Myxococcaceae bacterium]